MGYLLLARKWGASALGWVTQRGHWKWVAAALTVALLAFYIIQARQARDEATASQAALAASQGEVGLLREARITDNTVTAKSIEAKAVIETQEIAGRARTERALERHKDWADEPIPADIIDSLRD